MGALAKKRRNRVVEPVPEVLPEDAARAERMTRLLIGDGAYVPSLLELLRPSKKIVFRPRPPNPWGWVHFDSKLVDDR